MVAEKVAFSKEDYTIRRYVEAWEASRNAIASGGMLKHIDNAQVVAECAHLLSLLRDLVAKEGFKEESFLLKRLYGGNYVEGMPAGIRHIYEVIAKRSRLSKEKAEETEGLSDEKLMDILLNAEIKHLSEIEARNRAQDKERINYRSSAAVIPTQEAMDQLLRYATHISREIDKCMNRLERMQRRRKGLPMPPRIDVNMD
jgi:hypothetical protein